MSDGWVALLAWGFCCVGLVGMIGASLFVGRDARRREAIVRGRRLIRDVLDGEKVALVGRVILLRPALRAPFSQRDCAAFRGVQSQYVDTGGMGGNAERGRTEALSDFELEEKTGRARVAMSVGTIVEAKDVKVGNDGEWECYEWALTEGTRVCVIGVARWEQGATLDGPSSGTPPLVGRPFREAPRRLRIEAESLFPF